MRRNILFLIAARMRCLKSRPLFERLPSVARSTQVCIVVVEALLIAVYLTEKKDVYIPIQPTSLPEATSFSWGLPS
jgi:hypothetical protein